MGIVLPDHIGNAGVQFGLDLLFGQVQAVLVVDIDFLAVHDPGQCPEPLRRAEAPIGLTLVDELLGVIPVDAGRDSLALHIRADRAAQGRALVRMQAGGLQRAVDNIHRAFHLALLVRVLDTEQEISSLVPGDKISVKCCPQIANVHAACGAGGISCPDLHSVSTSFLIIVYVCI